MWLKERPDSLGLQPAGQCFQWRFYQLSVSALDSISSAEQLQRGLRRMKRTTKRIFTWRKKKAVLSHRGPCRAEREPGVSGSEGRTCAAAGSGLGLAAGISVFQVSQLKLLLSWPASRGPMACGGCGLRSSCATSLVSLDLPLCVFAPSGTGFPDLLSKLASSSTNAPAAFSSRSFTHP